MERLLLVGAGGFGRETAEAVRAVNACRRTWNLLGFLDDGPGLAGKEVDGTRVLGPTEAVADFPDACVIVTTGSPRDYFSRKRLVKRLEVASERFATLVHPHAVLPASARLGPGTVLLAGVVVTSGISIGSHVAVMPGAVLTHDNTVGDFATVASGVRFGGGVQVGTGAYVGAGALIREGLSIGDWALVGMGSVVLRSVPPSEVWAGAPARYLRRVVVPEDIAA
jgi:sugar O-acyltransferase (sialic acid O-acetyltransferase NeuD family)